MAVRTALLAIAVLLSAWTIAARAQTPTIVSLGYSGSGISTDLLGVIEKSKLWTRRGLDVRPVYFNSGTTLTQAMLGGYIVISDSDVPAQLNLKSPG
jgi:ABC-type nitrate/sulfonate/bicarbonate transport system substrate-binding protein